MSNPATVPLVQVWDQVYSGGGSATTAPAISGRKVKAQLSFAQATYSNPVVGIATDPVSTTTDSNGYWTMYLAANDLINPSGTLWAIQVEGEPTYLINVISTGVPVGGWQSSAIVVNTPAALGSTSFNIPGGATVNGAFTITGLLTTLSATISSVLNAVTARFGGSPWYDITHPTYGAVAGQDSTAAITAVLAAIASAGKGTMFIPDGTFICSGSGSIFAPVSNLRVKGNGPSSILQIKAANGNFGGLFVGASGLSNVIFEDLRIDLNVTNNTAGTVANSGGQQQWAISLPNATKVRIRRVVFDAVGGIQTVLIDGASVDDVRVTDCHVHFVMNGGAQPDYDNTAIYVAGTNKHLDRNTGITTIQAGRGARTFMELIGPGTANGNVVDGFRNGIFPCADNNVAAITGSLAVTGNQMRNVNVGIDIWALGANGLKGVTVAGNMVALAQVTHAQTFCKGIGFRNDATAAQSAQDIDISGNTIVFTEDETVTPRALSNTLNLGGIVVAQKGAVVNLAIVGNTVDGSPGNGIYVDSSDVPTTYTDLVIATNTILNPGQNTNVAAANRSGIRIQGGTLNEVTIANNKIHDNWATLRAGFGISAGGGATYGRVAVWGNTTKSDNGSLADSLTNLGANSTGLVVNDGPLATNRGDLTVASATATAAVIGATGATNPALTVDAATASSVTGVKVKSAGVGAGAAVSVTSSGTDEALKIDAKGAGGVTINGTGTGSITLGRKLISGGAAAPGISAVNGGITGTPTVVGNDTAGIISFTCTGTAPGIGATLFTVTFNIAYATTPVVICCNNSAEIAPTSLTFVAASTGTASFIVKNTVALTNSNSYKVAYWVIA